MASPRITPEKEVELIKNLLVERGVSDPERLGDIAPVWAIGLTNGAWRNTVIEDWHAGGGPLTDGAMMRINAYTTHGILRRLEGWMRTNELAPEGELEQLDDLEWDEVEELVELLATWLTRPERRLPIGGVLADLAKACRATVEEYAESAAEALDGFLSMVDERGASFAFLRTAAHGAAACTHWWSHPKWTSTVDIFLGELGAGKNTRLAKIGPRPEAIADLATLRSILLERPWELDDESAQWVVRADLQYVLFEHEREMPKAATAGPAPSSWA